MTEFGAFRLDPAERLLLRDGQPVALTPKAFDLLLYLVDRAGRLVEKQAVMVALWPDAIVEEGNLASTVSALRKALGDDEQRVIATVPTRGYRFVVPVVRRHVPHAGEAAVDTSNLPHRAAIRIARRFAAIALWSAVMVTVGWIISRQVGRPTSSAMFLRVGIEPAEGIRGSGLHSERWTTRNRPTRTAIALSPNGQSLVFAGLRGDQQQLWLRPLDRAEATPISGTDEASAPFFSPDGRWIGFWSRGSLWKVPVGGGAPTRICEAPLSYGASWGTDDAIVFADGEAGGLRRVAAAGGVPERLTTVNVAAGEGSHRLPHVLPGARAVVFTVVVVPTDTRLGTHVVVQSLDTGERRLLVRDAADGRYLPTGHLVYLAGGTLMAAPFDLATLRITGDSAGLVNGVMRSVRTAAAQFAVSASGSLAWLPAVVDSEPERLHTIVWVDQRGRSTRIEAAADTYYRPRLSPDGQQIAVDTVESVATIWIHDIRSARRTRIPFDGYANSPLWTPDGEHIVFSGSRAGSPNLFSIATNGSAPAQRLSTNEAVQFPASWTPDGRVLVYHQCAPQCDIWALSVSGNERKAWPVIESDEEEWYATLSPDGKWLAYMSNESGRHEVYVQPFPGPGARHAISAEGGMFPRWSPDGGKLYYVATSVTGPLRVTLPVPAHTGNTYVVVDVSTSPRFTASAPRVVFEDPDMKYTVTNPIAGYDIAPDGRFLMVETKRRAELMPPPPADVRLILNWSEQVRARVPTR